jgi:hypothetical protein
MVERGRRSRLNRMLAAVRGEKAGVQPEVLAGFLVFIQSHRFGAFAIYRVVVGVSYWPCPSDERSPSPASRLAAIGLR